MTIKQQGGIFGRNPAFNNVDVENNLTVGGTVTHNGTQNITGQLNVDNLRLDGNTVSVLDANGNLVLVPNGTGILDVYGDASIRKGNYQDVSLTIANGTATVGNKREILFTDQAGTTAYIRAYGSGYGSGLNNVLQLGSTTNYFNLTPAGNIAFPSGQGIDFSATSGTGTSELFDDYEEGTWTATVRGSTSDPSSALTATGYYTKIGDTVTAWVRIENGTSTGASGNASISGLPYTSNASVYAVNDVFCNQLNTASLLVQVDPSTTVIRLLQENGNAATWSSPGASMYATFQVTYKV